MASNNGSSNANAVFSLLDSMPSNITSSLPYILAALLGGVLLIVNFGVNGGSHSKGSEVPHLRGIPYLGSWSFYMTRYSLIQNGFRRFGGMFSFNLLNHKVIAIRGEESRKLFFGMKEMDFDAYQVLYAAAPVVDDVATEQEWEPPTLSWFGKRLTEILKRDRMDMNLPRMIKDLDNLMSRWGNSGQFDPFQDIYYFVFQLTIRAASSHRIADDAALVKRISELYTLIEEGSTATAVLLRWFPSPARKRKVKATEEPYNILKKEIDERVKDGKREEDSIQVLVDAGDGTDAIIGFIMGTLFAGIANSGIISCWLIIYLHTYPTWKFKVLDELKAFVSKHARPSSASQSFATRLQSIPAAAWEDGLDTLDLCLRETLRRANNGTMLRRFTGVWVDDEKTGEKKRTGMMMEGKYVEPGTFFALPASDAHLNEEIWTDATTWDPARFERGEDKKQQWAFNGWGVGRHPCLGMRFAKLEIKVITALFLMQYDYDVVDAKGQPFKAEPEPNYDDPYKMRPKPNEIPYIKYARVTPAV